MCCQLSLLFHFQFYFVCLFFLMSLANNLLILLNFQRTHSLFHSSFLFLFSIFFGYNIYCFLLINLCFLYSSFSSSFRCKFRCFIPDFLVLEVGLLHYKLSSCFCCVPKILNHCFSIFINFQVHFFLFDFF